MRPPCAPGIAEIDVINSATPLEIRLLGVHPRLYLDEAGFETLRQSGHSGALHRAVESLIGIADASTGRAWPESEDAPGDHRGVGSTLPCLALAWKLTGKPEHLQNALACMDAMGRWKDWDVDLEFGHFAYGFAVALDWLWHDVDESRREALIDTLHRNVTVVFDHWRSYRSGPMFSHACNHRAVGDRTPDIGDQA